MPEQNESLVRTAYAAFSQGDVATMLELVHPGLEWTFLDPAFANPEPRTCLGREQLQRGQITALRACRDRDEARRLTGLS
jgi:ketosteroid isomerase-like protein